MDTPKQIPYRDFIKNWLEESGERGSRVRLANAAGCSPSWMSRALNGDVHLTPDQALAIATEMDLSETETELFINLVDLERASTPALRKRIQKKIDSLKRDSRKLNASIRSESNVSDEHASRYYSTWVYPAIHVACMVKSQTSAEIAKMLRLGDRVVSPALRELQAMTLLESESGRWRATSRSLHLSADHPVANVANRAWRERTIQHLLEGSSDGLHYAGVHCLSQVDVEKIYATLKKTILEARAKIDRSPPETLAVFCLDWFELAT